MMTGRLPVRGGIGFRGTTTNGVFTSEAVGGIPPSETTIAEALSHHGYNTYMVGKVVTVRWLTLGWQGIVV